MSILPPVDGGRIQAGDSLVLRNANDKSCYVLRVNGEQKIGKFRVILKDCIDNPYSSYYELNGRKFMKIPDVQEDENVNDGENTIEDLPQPPQQLPFNSFTDTEIKSYVVNVVEKNATTDVIRGDNSGYVDTNTAQKLKDADIVKLREQGLSGEEIIKSLIDNSDTFAKKSDFAQAKWIKRKEKKYRKRYQILKATPFSICEASLFKNKEKVSNMRYESLAQILGHAGIFAGTRVLVFESMVGLIVGSLAYRMRGEGRILSFYAGQQPHLDIVRNLNLDAKSLSIIENIPSTELGPAAKEVATNGFIDAEDFPPLLASDEKQSSSSSSSNNQDNDDNKTDLPVSEATSTTNTTATTATEDDEPVAPISGKQPSKKRKLVDHTTGKGGIDPIVQTGRSTDALSRTRSYLRQGVDRLILATRYRPLPILKQLLYVLLPSSSFVIYHEFMEPLVDCYLYLQETGLGIRLQLFDSWLREFQTLPGRMRPDMFMTTHGGFILTGIYVGMVPCEYPRECVYIDHATTAAQEEHQLHIPVVEDEDMEVDQQGGKPKLGNGQTMLESELDTK